MYITKCASDKILILKLFNFLIFGRNKQKNLQFTPYFLAHTVNALSIYYIALSTKTTLCSAFNFFAMKMLCTHNYICIICVANGGQNAPFSGIKIKITSIHNLLYRKFAVSVGKW